MSNSDLTKGSDILRKVVGINDEIPEITSLDEVEAISDTVPSEKTAPVDALTAHRAVFKNTPTKSQESQPQEKGENDLEDDWELEDFAKAYQKGDIVTNDKTFTSIGNEDGEALKQYIQGIRQYVKDVRTKDAKVKDTQPAPSVASKPTVSYKPQPEPVQPSQELRPADAIRNKASWAAYLKSPKEKVDFRIDNLPSNFVPYPGVTSLHVTRLTVDELARIHFIRDMAIKSKAETLAFSNMLDIINQKVTCGDGTPFDVRDLIYVDMRYVLYYIRTISYPKHKDVLIVTSKYGNKNTVTVNNAVMDMTPLQMTVEEYQNWFDMGFRIPTTGHYEWYTENASSFTDDIKYKIGKAQYLAGDSILDKLEHLEARVEAEGLDFMNQIQEFADLLKVDLKEYFMFKDPLFTTEGYLKNIDTAVYTYEKLLPMATETEQKEILYQINLLVEAAKNITDRISRGETIEAEEEKIYINTPAWDFFPLI